MKKAVVLLSGGLDSTTVLAIAKNIGYEIYALSFSYGQRHEIELESANNIARDYGVKEHKIAKIDLRLFGGSALTADIDIPKSSVQSTEIPVTYVPARNTIFLSFALAYAETVGAFDIFIGVNAVDYSNYPDCRPEFIQTFEKLANLATAAGAEDKGNFKIHGPLIEMSKKEIIEEGIKLGVDYGKTHSCYDPIFNDDEVKACGKCDSCRIRVAGFEAAGIQDPLL
jgi:7-cyano-7-deazaguanine synthase